MMFYSKEAHYRYNELPGNESAHCRQRSRNRRLLWTFFFLGNLIIIFGVFSYFTPVKSVVTSTHHNETEPPLAGGKAPTARVVSVQDSPSVAPTVDLAESTNETHPASSELQNRQESQFRRYGRVGLRIARYAAGPTLGFGFWGLVDDCKDMSEKEDKVASGVKCVIGSIGTAMGAGLTLHDGWIKVQEYWGKVNAVGLYYLNDGAGVVKRDLELLEEKMSSALRSEVRHIGNWDGTSIGDVFKRDDENTTYPVFGATMNGMDLHFTVTGGEGNRTNFRIGYGPGPDTDKNTQRLRRRNVQYNKQYFSKGGLDFKVEQTHLDKDHVFMVPERQDDFDWLYEQVECYMTNHAGFGSMPISNPLADFLQTLLSDIKGLNYQVLNTLAKNTIAAGAIAPFGADTPSMIGEMGVDYGIVPDPSCTTELYKRGTLI